MTRAAHHTEAETAVFWSVWEAKHGLRRPPLTDANGDTAEPLPTTDHPEERE